jgi:hypothetical protein
MAVNPTSLRVDIRSQYTCSRDTGKVTVDDAELLNILKIVPEESLGVCQNRFPEMTWMDVAKAIAKNVYRVDINDDQAWELAKILIKDNKMTVGEKIKKYGLLGCGCDHKVDSTKVHYYYAWEGNFPDKLTIKISADFKKAMAGMMATPEKTEKKHGTHGTQGTQGTGGSHMKPPELSITASLTPLTVELSASLPKGYKAQSYQWKFDDGRIMTDPQAKRVYPLDEIGRHTVILQVTTDDGKAMICTKQFEVFLKNKAL